MRRIAYDNNLVGRIALDFGCGDQKHQRPNNNVRMDAVDFGQEIVADVLTTGIPLPDNSCVSITASHVMEHMPWGLPLIDVFNECWRVLKPTGVLYVIVPGRSNPCVNIPVHTSQFDEHTFRFFDGEHDQSTSDDTVRRSYQDVRLWKIHELVTNQRGDIHCHMSPKK